MVKAIILYFFFQLIFANDLQNGDELYKQRKHLSNVHLALKNYENHLKTQPNSIDALWRMSMANYYIGHRLEKTSEKTKYFRQGEKLGKQCVQLSNRKSVECLFWLGTNTALLNKEHGVLSLAFGVGHMIALFEEAKNLDPNYASSGAYRMLALLYFKTPRFFGGDKKKAIKYIKFAIKNSPNEPMNVYFYIMFLVKNNKMIDAIKISTDFLKRSNPKEYNFYESHKAHRKLQHFISTKELTK